MKTRIAFVSDLHLGALAPLDEFRWDDRFATLLAHPRLAPSADAPCQLVVLGDAFDLWQAVPESDCTATETGTISLDYSPATEVARLEAVAARHPTFFQAVKAFATSAGGSVTFVPGNHDHALVHPDVQAALRRACGLGGGEGKLAFASAVDRPDLDLYAEHGNQLERNNRYRDFEALDAGKECRGYPFVRLFWNRMEYRDPALQDNGSYWGAIWRHLSHRKEWGLFALALRYFRQYWNDPRVKAHVTPFDAAPGMAPPDPRVDLSSSPTFLAGGRPGPDRVFALDPSAERLFREAYQASEEVRAEVDVALAEARAAHPGLPALDLSPGTLPASDDVTAAGTPEDVASAEELAAGKGSFPMQASSYGIVLIGHTHRERCQRLAGGALYINTGAWSRGGDLPVALAEADGPGPARAQLLHLSEGGILG